MIGVANPTLNLQARWTPIWTGYWTGSHPYVLIAGCRLVHCSGGSISRAHPTGELRSHEVLDLHPGDAARLHLNLVEVPVRPGNLLGLNRGRRLPYYAPRKKPYAEFVGNTLIYC